LTVNSALLENNTRVLQSEFEFTAIALGDALLEEVWPKAFDDTTVSLLVDIVPAAFTDPSALGPEGAESYPNFDDVDDYNTLSLSGTAGNGMTYTLTVSVVYVTEDDTENYTTTETFLKRVDVTVNSDYLSNEITTSHIFSFVR